MVMKKVHQAAPLRQSTRISGGMNQDLNINILKEESDGTAVVTPQNQEVEKQGNYYDQEAIREINSLSRFFRRYKIFQRFKELVQREKYERDLQVQKEKLTSNQCLWEQLGEAEKRENIIRQELYFAQQNLSTYEKIIGKLQHQLETLQNEKLRLLQFKATKSKQIEAMESKIRDVEILENIDLQKVIDELQSREKKLKQLQSQNEIVNDRIQQEQIFNERKVADIKRQLEKERNMKVHAFDQLEAMRLEIKAIEGKDMGNGELWKQKCKELFDICKDLQKENEDLKSGVPVIGGGSASSATYFPAQQNYDSQAQEEAQHYYSMPQVGTEKNTLNHRDISQKRTELHTLGSSHDPKTKPSTAQGGNRLSNQPRLLSRGGTNHPGTAPGGPRQHQIQHPWSGHPSLGNQNIHHADMGASATMTSGLSLPELMMMGPGGQNSSIPNDHSEGGNQSSSPLSSTILNQKSSIKDNGARSGYYQVKSREHILQPFAPQNPHLMNSNEIFTMHPINQASSEQILAHNRKKQVKGRSTLRQGGVSGGYQTVNSGLRLVDRSDEGSLVAHPNPNFMVGGVDMKKTGGPVARSTAAGVVFNSSEAAHKAQTRITSGNNQISGGNGSNLIANQNMQINNRLMTSKGPRRTQAIVNDPSTTGTLYSSNLQQTRELGGTGFVMMPGGPASMRKSTTGIQPPSSNNSRGGFVLQGHNPQAITQNTGGNLNLAAGMAIANSSLPMGPAQIVQKQAHRGSSTSFNSSGQQPINFNINFNTTNFNLK